MIYSVHVMNVEEMEFKMTKILIEIDDKEDLDDAILFYLVRMCLKERCGEIMEISLKRRKDLENILGCQHVGFAEPMCRECVNYEV